MAHVVDLWTRAGIRKQLTAVAVMVVTVPLVLGVVLLANLLTSALVKSLVTATKDVAQRTADQVQDHGVAALPGDLQLEDQYRVQVLDMRGTVLWTSNPRYHQPFTTAHPATGKYAVEGATTWWGPGDNEQRDVVVARGTEHEGTRYVVLVDVSQGEQHHAVSVTTGLLLACVPLVMLAAGVTAWWVSGRALRPVDEMTRQVGHITSTTLDERVPLPAAQDELRNLAQTMNGMLAGLEKTQDSQRRFVSDASHELRSPLASLSGALEIARLEDRHETWREMAPLMAAETSRMNHLVQDLLTLTRRDDVGSPLHLGDVDLDDLAATQAARLRGTTELDVHTSIATCRVQGDPALLRQVLVNLCDNAARHAHSRVAIGVQPRDERSDGAGALVWVEDDGNGIAPEERERVFDRFVRLEESRNRDEGGSGLGLAIVRQTVLAHGGTVRVTDSELGGARFEVELPEQPERA